MHVIVRHKVKDYPVWKQGFDSHSETRKAGGEKSYEVFNIDGDPNYVAVLFEWDNIENAKKFITSSDLKEAMEKAGVIGKPEITFLNELEKGSLA